MRKQIVVIVGLLNFFHLVSSQTLPQLPNTSSINKCLPDQKTYKQITVGPIGRDYSDLQKAINEAQSGTIIILDAGQYFRGSFNLPKKQGNDWIIITSSKMNLLPEEGKRIQPNAITMDPNYKSQSDAMPKIITVNKSGLPCFTTQASAHHYRLMGLEISIDTAVHDSYGLVVFGDASSNQNNLNQLPHDFIVDRCYIHGHSNATIMKSGVILNCANSAVLNSVINDFHSIGYDTYAIGGTNGPGPFIIENNELEAAGENIIFGGAAASIPGLVPSDIEITNNYFYKNPTWRTSHPSYQGKHWTIKNLFELKTGKRVLLDGNMMEYSWADLPIGQSGYAIVLTVRSEGGGSPQADVSDITISNNIIRHVGAGITLSRMDSPSPSLQSKRIHIFNNLFDDIDGAIFGDLNVDGPNDGIFLKIGNPDDVTVEQNTTFQTGAITWAFDSTKNIRIQNNIFKCYLSKGGYQGIYGPGFAQGGNGPMMKYFPGISDANQKFNKNVLIGGNESKYSNYNTISNNYFPMNESQVKFINYASGANNYLNYALSTESPYYLSSTKKKNIGVDFELLKQHLEKTSSCIKTGTNEVLKKVNFTVQNSPGIKSIKIASLIQNTEEAKIRIFNLTSIQVFESIFRNEIEISTINFPSGVYTYQISSGLKNIQTGIIAIE